MDRRHGQHNQHDVAQQTKWGPNYLLLRFKVGRNSFLVIYIYRLSRQEEQVVRKLKAYFIGSKIK